MCHLLNLPRGSCRTHKKEHAPSIRLHEQQGKFQAWEIILENKILEVSSLLKLAVIRSKDVTVWQMAQSVPTIEIYGGNYQLCWTTKVSYWLGTGAYPEQTGRRLTLTNILQPAPGLSLSGSTLYRPQAIRCNFTEKGGGRKVCVRR
jgi:hypothetical protein